MKRYALMFAALVVGAPCVAVTQDQSTDSTRLLAIARFRPGSWVRLAVQGRGRIEGRFLGITDATSPAIAVKVERNNVAYPVATVDSVWVHGMAGGHGAAIGGLVGGAVGGVILGAVARSLILADRGTSNGVFNAGFTVGAVGGGLLGALIGMAAPRWHLRVP